MPTPRGSLKSVTEEEYQNSSLAEDQNSESVEENTVEDTVRDRNSVEEDQE